MGFDFYLNGTFTYIIIYIKKYEFIGLLLIRILNYIIDIILEHS